MLSAGYFIIRMDSTSIRFGAADLGAMPAKPMSTPRIIPKP